MKNNRLFLIVGLVLIPFFVRAQSVDVVVHDPVMIEHDGMYYIFHTDYGLKMWSSPDLENWKMRE